MPDKITFTDTVYATFRDKYVRVCFAQEGETLKGWLQDAGDGCRVEPRVHAYPFVAEGVAGKQRHDPPGDDHQDDNDQIHRNEIGAQVGLREQTGAS